MNQFTPLPQAQQGEKLSQHFPVGKAWEAALDDQTNLGKLLMGLGAELYRVELAIELLSNDFEIQQTSLLIREWEISVGIPDDCFDISGDIQERRDSILTKIRDAGVRTVDDFVDVAALFGVVVRIEPGVLHGLFPLLFPIAFYDSAKTARFTMIVDQPGVREVFPILFPIPFSAGISGIVECLFLKLRPANVQIIFLYGRIDENGDFIFDFLPDRIDGLVLWLDAADPNTITESGGSISQWDDKSGNSNNLKQSVGADQPSLNAPFSLASGVSFSGNSFDISSEDASPMGIAFNNDGTKLFMVGAVNNTVYEYTLTTPFSLASGVSFSGNSFDVGSEDGTPSEISFNNAGTKLFMVGIVNNTVYEYTLTTPFSLASGVSFSGNSFDISSEELTTRGIAFNNDGTKLFIVGNDSNTVYEYTLTTPFSLASGVSFSGNSFDISSEDTFPRGISFDNDGTKLFIVGNDNDSVFEYTLTTPFNLASGVSFSGNSFDISSEELTPTGISFNNDGTKLFMIGTVSNSVFEYDLGDGSIVFDGVSQFLEADSFSFTQPKTIYILFLQESFTDLDAVYDGNLGSSGVLRQALPSSDLEFATNGFSLGPITTFPLNVYGVVSVVASGVNGVLQLNNETPLVGDTGTEAMNGFNLGRSPGLGRFSNIGVKEVIAYSGAHDSEQRLEVIEYLNNKWELGI